MRHDAHYVEELSSHHSTPIGRLLYIASIDPNPEQPRVEVGDLTDLASSIREKGVLEPLLVKPSPVKGRWMIIAGERRWRASKIAGLKEVPCIEMDVDEGAVAEIALIENLQRKDLTPWEEADGLAALCEKHGYTHDDVAKKVGKSRTTVTEALAIAALPEVIREQCRRADINAKSMLLEIVRQPDDASMHRLLNEISLHGLSREDLRKERQSKQGASSRKKSASPERCTYKSPNGDFKVEVSFKKREIERKDIELALQEALKSFGKRSNGVG
ncbi:MAG: ParB family transcriptional regulator, chromosome partitioning protein [Acidobacteriota bacterium]|nr:ParB family transcriptional regulator, chromosome partitioning protein [Acidobacteriota bacterium]